MALIECLLHRKGGSFIDMVTQVYHFAPGEDGRHLAVVDDEAHVRRLLEIHEAYRLVDGQPAHPDVAPATVEETQLKNDSTQDADSKAERRRLSAAYKEKFGQNPPPRWSAERIAQEIEG